MSEQTEGYLASIDPLVRAALDLSKANGMSLETALGLVLDANRYERLRAALRPFAALASEVDRLGHLDDSTCMYRLRAGDLRAARRALLGDLPDVGEMFPPHGGEAALDGEGTA